MIGFYYEDPLREQIRERCISDLTKITILDKVLYEENAIHEVVHFEKKLACDHLRYYVDSNTLKWREIKVLRDAVSLSVSELNRLSMVYDYVYDLTICYINKDTDLLKNIKEIGEIKSRYDFFLKDSLNHTNFYSNQLLKKMDDSSAAVFCKVNGIDLKAMSAKKGLIDFYKGYKNKDNYVDFFTKYPMFTEQFLKHREFLINSYMDRDEKNMHVRNTYFSVSVNKPCISFFLR